MLKKILDKFYIKKEIRRIEGELLQLVRDEKDERARHSLVILEIQAARETYCDRQKWLKQML